MTSRWPAIIAHADMDAFYAAVEQHDDPSLLGKPLIIGPKSRRGVVLTASYEARPYGVGSAMPMAQALDLCPDAVVVSPRFERYQEVSAQVMKVFANFSPVVEPLSLDEAFLDMTGAEGIFGTPKRMGVRIKLAVREATGLTVSVGISSTKYVAKVASGYAKPDGLTVVRPEDVRRWLAPLSVSLLWGVGKKTQARLNSFGFERIGDLAVADPRVLTAKLGRSGLHFRSLALGEDPRSVESHRREKSIGSERTLERNVVRASDIENHLRRAADRIGERLRAKGYLAGGVRVKLKTAGFQLMSRQCHVQPTDTAEVLFRAARRLAKRFSHPGPFRLVGMAAFDVRRPQESNQLDLFDDRQRQRKLETTLDSVKQRFGRDAMKRARDLDSSGTVFGNAPTLDFLQRTKNVDDKEKSVSDFSDEFVATDE